MARKYTKILAAFALSALMSAPSLSAQESDQVTAADLANATLKYHAPHETLKARPARSALLANSVQGLDSIQTFGGFYSVFGYDDFGNPKTNWSYEMIGNSPASGVTTTFRAPITPVSLLMLNANGTPRSVNGQLLYSDATQYARKVLESPVFQNYAYSSSRTPTQIIDALQRAEFWSTVGRDDEAVATISPAGEAAASAPRGWHTLLEPKLATPKLMVLPHGSYQFALNSNGSCCAFVLVDINTFYNLLFPPSYPFDGSTIIGAAELSGEMTTKDISSFLFPNTFLYLNGNPKDCCVGGFHLYDYEPGTPKNGNLPRLYVMNYSSWISPGIFGEGSEDIVALSHELSETANDPFVDNATPWWLAPFGLCQNNLEVGDVIEGLPNATYPIKMNGFTYHPQNEAMLPWFEFKKAPGSIDGAYSYPDTHVLTALSPVERAACK